MCYSDHDEDIRTKGNCDYCGSGITSDLIAMYRARMIRM
jgi:hypothetical protein